MLNKEGILALAWEHSEGSGKRYTFTEESLFELLKELKKEPAPVQDEALRKDAERYRFLCDPEDADEDCLAHAVNTLNAWADKSEIDQAIDAAMSAKDVKS